jgi:hypothetical protein
MAEFDPERFEEEKYRDYFPQLQRAYRDAFETMNDEYDSELVHAIDQQLLDESEPFFEDGAFRIELPGEPAERVTGVVVAEDKLEATVDSYVAELESSLARVFGVDADEPKV